MGRGLEPRSDPPVAAPASAVWPRQAGAAQCSTTAPGKQRDTGRLSAGRAGQGQAEPGPALPSAALAPAAAPGAVAPELKQEGNGGGKEETLLPRTGEVRRCSSLPSGCDPAGPSPAQASEQLRAGEPLPLSSLQPKAAPGTGTGPRPTSTSAPASLPGERVSSRLLLGGGASSSLV